MLYDSLEIVFRSLWTWLSMRPGRKKSDWPDWCIARDMMLKATHKHYLEELAHCPACAEDIRIRRLKGDRGPCCTRCPIQWDGVPYSPNTSAPCTQPGSPFDLWGDIRHYGINNPTWDYHERALAYKIANMKWRKW